MEKRYKVGQYVYSTRLGIAVEVIPEYDSNILFSCSVQAANRYDTIYPRLASGLEVFDLLARRERLDKKFKQILKNLDL